MCKIHFSTLKSSKSLKYSFQNVFNMFGRLWRVVVKMHYSTLLYYVIFIFSWVQYDVTEFQSLQLKI